MAAKQLVVSTINYDILLISRSEMLPKRRVQNPHGAVSISRSAGRFEVSQSTIMSIMQSQVKPNSISKPRPCRHEYSIAPFETPRVKLMLQSRPQTQPFYLSTRTFSPHSPYFQSTTNKINLNATSKVACVGFMKLGEITYAEAEKKNLSKTCI